MGINFDLAVLNGRVYTASGLKTIDIWIREGRVAALGGPHRAMEKIDAKGMLVLPGCIDSHVHFRDPGKNYKEDWLTGSTAAVAGGITTVIDQPNTDPRTLDTRSFEIKLDLASAYSVVDFCINGGPGKIGELKRAGATAIGEIFSYEHSDSELKKILEETGRHGMLATVHAEDGSIIKERTEALSARQDPEVYSLARPASAEVAAIEKAHLYSDYLHICHLSSGQGLNMIEQARSERAGRGNIKAGRSGHKRAGPEKISSDGGDGSDGRNKAAGEPDDPELPPLARGLRLKGLSCEVTPHHLLLNIKDYKKQRSYLKMNPPLRSSTDNERLWQGLRTGSIDILASDHAPHLPGEKREGIWEAPAGVPGVETMLPLMLSAVKRNLISLDRVMDALAARPAEIFGLARKGTIVIGKDADIVLVDPKRVTEIRGDRLHSRADWTPYEGMQAIFPQMTILRGTVVYDGDLLVRPGCGRFQGMQKAL